MHGGSGPESKGTAMSGELRAEQLPVTWWSTRVVQLGGRKHGLGTETKNVGGLFAGSFAGKAWEGASVARVGCREERGPASFSPFFFRKWESPECV